MSKISRFCQALDLKSPGDRAKLKEFSAYAQSLGYPVNTDDDLWLLCKQYARRRRHQRRLTEEDVTGGLRSPESYTRHHKDIIQLVTLQEGVLPVGSYKFNVHKYASDIDIMERINVCCSVDEAKKQVARGIQNIGRLIRAAPDVYLGDFKAGKDDRFSIDLGTWVPLADLDTWKNAASTATTDQALSEDESMLMRVARSLGLLSEYESQDAAETSTVEKNQVLVGYNPARVEKSIRRLAQGRLISLAEMRRLQALIQAGGSSPSMAQWEEMAGLIRDHQVLRWSPQELSQGYKILPGFRKLTLENALGQKTLVKLDAWAKVNGRWLEVTNFFLINAVDPSGAVIEQLTQDMPDYISSMSKDVKHYSSPDHRKTLKALKRLWALSIFKRDYDLANRINPIFSSPGAALNQVAGDAEVLRLMLTKLDDPPVEDIMEQIDAFKPRIDQLNQVVELNADLFSLVNSIVDPFFQQQSVNDFTDFDGAIAGLEKLESLVGQAVETMISRQATTLDLANPGNYV